MIRIREATQLAYTKLKTRKIRLLVTVVISCLLFSALAGASLIFRGVFKGVDNFNQEGFGKRYIVGGRVEMSNDYEILNNQDLISRAITENNALIIRKKAEAKRLDIEYNPVNDQLPYFEADNGQGRQKSLEPTHPISRKIIDDYRKTHPSPGITEMKKLAEPYRATALYENQAIGYGNPDYALKVLKDGKEEFNPTTNNDSNPFERGTGSFTANWNLMSGSLLEPFMLSGTNKEVGSDGSIPVVAPYTAVEQLLSLEPLAQTASADDKLARIKHVRQKASTINFSVCYRNQTSVSAIEQAVQTQQEIERNKNTKDYKKPNLIYNLPKAACGDVEVASDTRTSEQKKMDAKQAEFDRIFGVQPKTSQIIKFRVIGIAPDPQNFAALGVSQIFASILTSSIGSGWFTPLEIKSQNPLFATIFSSSLSSGISQIPSVFAEFAEPAQATDFIKQQNCHPDFGPSVNFGPAGPFEACLKEGKPFTLSPFGSSSLALIQIKKGFSKFFRIAATVIAVIAAIIMMGTLGRIVADSRRETAVFRAIGAKQLDIAQIYITYILLLSLFIAGLALIIGFILASIANARYADSLTVEALLAYNAQDLSREVHLYAFELRDMAYLVGFTVLAGLASAILPLLSNVRRNPIRDMRDEN